MDSCAVMRGSKNGLEKKIRDRRAPHLLDIDGDSCHHLNNASKKLCSPFERWVESLLSDLHTDHKWSADMKDGLREICSIFGIHFSRPECYIPHRWLSVLDVSLETLRMWDALVLFYYAFLSNEDKCTYKDVVSAILQKREVQETGRARIKELWKELGNRSKNFTNEGKMKVLFEDKKTLLELHFYSAVLPMLKHYVLLFQSKDPKVHKLHDEQEKLVREFLSCFIKPEELIDSKGRNLSGPKMKLLDLTSTETHLAAPFVGSEASSILDQLGRKHPLVKAFKTKVESAFSVMSNILQAKASNLSVETYESYQVVKYNLKAMQVSAIQHYSRKTK
ncbi:hypothetical protein F2P79_022099 [Pimephales promelas]|nr:hypothetical protein F2P79_022099 [Pimephales promelas]